MTDDQLERNLKSIGQACFVKYFQYFSNALVSREDIIEILRSETTYTEKSCISRIGHARSIIKAGLARVVLQRIVNSDSPKVSESTRAQAQLLLDSFDGVGAEPTDAPGHRRVVKTGRTLETINAAAREGFRPLVKWVQPGDDIHQMLAVFQDTTTGEIELSGDFRRRGQGEMVIDYTTYYPYHFTNPFAAYLVPSDIAVGEEVWLNDLIEDLVAVWGNQCNHPRLKAAAAVWNGADFIIQFDPQRDADRWIG